MTDVLPLQHSEAGPRQWRRRARIGLATLLPMTLVVWLPVLSSERFARCLTYGEGCAPAVLGDVAWWAFWGSAAIGVTASVLNPAAERARRLWLPLVCLQLALQGITGVAIIAMA
ncbi:hypothetical protein DVA86_29295 [Streptomyces armeniacus]|uniref:Uncharacterized protein n=1 Tax=Streptomyces armeniacus TaxID=83291 RepID=A0A345XWR8_9ACTN|nr:hypothetical protein [Streptomyces armeniacus]AXK36084.1 hypothetical protein DVA86_29295 [Streptomyces armeniacus]